MGMASYQHANKGTCSRTVDFEIAEDGTVHNVSFVGGCHGNLQAVGKLVEGLPATEVVARLKGIDCGGRGTSCGDQLAQGIEEVL